MMSDKRFERWNDHSCKVKDNQEDTLLNWEDVVDLLNEQQDIIEEQNKEIEESSAFIIEQREELSKIFPNEQRINQGETIIQSKDGIGERVL